MLYIEQNVIQVCQLEFFTIWRMWTFLSKNTPWDFSPNGNIWKSRKKIGLQTISLVFELVSPLKEVFLGASNLLDASCQHIHCSLIKRKCVIWWRFADYEDFISYGGWCWAFTNMQAQQHIFPYPISP